MASSVPLTWNEALSGIFGTISLASWVFLLLPQLWENYAQGHAEGISLTFLFIWALGDVANLVGAVWAGLVPTVIALAVYFTFADCVLIAQCLWYKWRKGEESQEQEEGRKAQGNSEQTPLLGDGTADGNGHVTGSLKQHRRRRSFMDVTDENLGLPGSRRRSSTASSHRRPAQHNRTASTTDSLTPISEQQQQPPTTTATRETIKNTLSILAINLAGAAAWYLAYRTGAWKPVPVGTPSSSTDDDATPLGASILGYLSAIAYLGARIPQIIKNHRSRSCEGLSLLFFLLSLLGNATYGAGILFHSQEREYVVTNLPWLIGSLGTMVEDVVIFGQFHVFGDGKAREEGEAVE
ncbi:vacuolar membrane PQ loop repeat protein [Hortaea werneckii]|uniref:PQ-loop-domain-containing protein n=1 Tax=Hortaea werneckii TaxID=91943 RepID=A0A3M7ADN2_HORWE|nr:vacuolar membrane PQ loop repeat protein [Hortaea werneckii]KAI7027873.1 vacuolar membrane PQ loop repeat protein [Hortaea werneckii]KAI7676582.1 vacuolar membrane PQ loop repeat protein [Hortaea werneckii]RMY25558.1 hypothetical protein D0867_00649 [Hortaea werneckii]RMY40297.1 hypothetical protein D0866_01356 [Hortaea werneckii]